MFSLLPYVLTKDNQTKEKTVWSLFSDTAGELWAGGENEVVRFKDGKISNIYDLTPYLRNDKECVYAITRAGGKMLLSIFEDGILSLDPETGAASRLPLPGERNYANTFVKATDGSIYIGSQGGLYRYDDGEISRMEDISKAISYLIPNGIAFDPQGNLWIGTYGDGVFIFDKNGGLKHHLNDKNGLISNAVKQLLADAKGRIWIAGQDGLSLIKDYRTPGVIENFYYSSGLDDIHIRSVVEDRAGNIWLSNSSGLTRLNMKTGRFENYDHRDGMPLTSLMDRAGCASPDGNIYFGSLNGICNLKPESFTIKPENIPVRIVECQNLLSPHDGKGHSKVMSGTEREVKVPYDMNSLRILFSTPDFAQSRSVEYSYKVEGIDNEWIPAGKNHSATLRNLSPGKYDFKVRARLRNQDWDDSNITSLKIIVTPPFWQTWYAKLLYVAALGIIIWLAIRFYKHRLLLKSSLEMERRKSIDEQQLNNERLRFFTNITHELRTPLTLILGPLEDLVYDKKLPANYSSKIGTIHASALRLLSLVNQILEFRKTETQNRRLAVAKGQIANIVREIGLRYKELNHNEKEAINIKIEDNIPTSISTAISCIRFSTTC